MMMRFNSKMNQPANIYNLISFHDQVILIILISYLGWLDSFLKRYLTGHIPILYSKKE